MRALLRLVAVAALAALTAACAPDKPSFQLSDVTGSAFAKDFALTDHNGKPRTLVDFRGKAVVMFFGYVQCPDVCPTTMSTLAQAMKQLGADADRVQVLFVTVDPERDTPALLNEYVPAFDPRFLGLWGDTQAIDRVVKEYRVLYRKNPGSTPDTYTVDHTAGAFVYDPQGRLRLYAGHGKPAEAFAHDLRELLRTTPAG
jgi:protein SCO1/2